MRGRPRCPVRGRPGCPMRSRSGGAVRGGSGGSQGRRPCRAKRRGTGGARAPLSGRSHERTPRRLRTGVNLCCAQPSCVGDCRHVRPTTKQLVDLEAWVSGTRCGNEQHGRYRHPDQPPACRDDEKWHPSLQSPISAHHIPLALRCGFERATIHSLAIIGDAPYPPQSVRLFRRSCIRS